MKSHANSVLGRGGAVAFIFPYRVPRWQLRRMIACEVMPAHSDFYVEYSTSGASVAQGRRRGEGARRRFEVKDGQLVAGADAELARRPSLLMQKLVSFKSVAVEDAECGVCHGP